MPLKSFKPVTLCSLEIDETILLLMATADVAHGDTTLVIATTGAFFDFEEAFFRL